MTKSLFSPGEYRDSETGGIFRGTEQGHTLSPEMSYSGMTYSVQGVGRVYFIFGLQ